METFATPGTPIKRGTIVHRARTDISIKESSSDDKPIFSTRLVDDRGLSIAGGFETPGNANIDTSRSCTICRAFIMSVPGSKIRMIDESPAIDSERISSTHETPFSISASIGVVIRASISVAESPSASV